MPYIPSQDRVRLVPESKEYPLNAGELNFQITCLLKDYLKANGSQYKQINDVLGALEGAKLEFYRVVAAPYEEKKMKENGEVYGTK